MGGGALFIDMLDQDGHRVELFNTHDQAIDLEPSRGSNLSDPRRADLWGFPARERWCVEVSRFAGVDPVQPALKASTRTVEEGQRLAAWRSDREV